MNSNVIDEKLENLFDEWKDRMKKNGDMNFTKDGILRKKGIPDTKVIETWMASSKRILFLLKDQNQEGGKWDEDIRDWLTVNENTSNLGSTFLKNIAYILWGLSKADENNDWWYNEVTMHFDEVKEYIEDILHDQNDINEQHGAQLEAISIALSELQTQKHQEKPMQQIGFNSPMYDDYKK